MAVPAQAREDSHPNETSASAITEPAMPIPMMTPPWSPRKPPAPGGFRPAISVTSDEAFAPSLAVVVAVPGVPLPAPRGDWVGEFVAFEAPVADVVPVEVAVPVSVAVRVET